MTEDTRELAHRISSRTPARSHEARGIIERCLSGSVCDSTTGYKIALINLPSEAERGRLQARYTELMKALRDHDRKEIGAVIADMLGSYDVSKKKYKTKKDMYEVVAKYVADLSGVPTWAIQIACERIRMGVAPDISHVYEPTTIQVRVLAVSIAQPYKDEVISIGNIMMADQYIEPVSAEEQARVGPLLRQLADGMKANLAEEERQHIEAYHARQQPRRAKFIEAEWAAHGEKPLMAGGVMVSRSLSELLKKQVVRSD
jgi:hypothetical protein